MCSITTYKDKEFENFLLDLVFAFSILQCLYYPKYFKIEINLTFFSSVAQQLNSGLGRLIVEVSISLSLSLSLTHTHTHTQYDSSEREISSSQRPPPTQQTTTARAKRTCLQRDLNPQF